jgi:hypothetical protein
VVLAHLAPVQRADRLQHGLPDAARARRASFKEFVEEWIVTQFLEVLEAHGLERPGTGTRS